MIGLSGSHRCGKTTLAKAYAEKHGLFFLETSASAIFREFDLDPAVTYNFDVRLMIQQIILDRFDVAYGKHAGNSKVITDRTPLDLLAYTLGDVSGQTLRPDQEALLRQYVNDCFDVANRRFSTILVVQPGIPLVYEEGKAAMSEGYIEHLNSLILGLSVDERLRSLHYYMPRSVTDLNSRLQALHHVIERGIKRAEAERETALTH